MTSCMLHARRAASVARKGEQTIWRNRQQEPLVLSAQQTNPQSPVCSMAFFCPRKGSYPYRTEREQQLQRLSYLQVGVSIRTRPPHGVSGERRHRGARYVGFFTGARPPQRRTAERRGTSQRTLDQRIWAAAQR